MNRILKLTLIGVIGAIVLMLALKLVMILNGNQAYILLFNFDYIPVINTLKPVWLFGYIFHFLTCIISVIALFYILGAFYKRIMMYVLVYAIGGGALYFLTALSDQPPAPNDVMAWIYWTIAHALFGFVVGYLVKKWI
ncbi:hypothetical protein [Gelidibacter salicanalis]|uniref:Uncharacterized protein n=1 Tax=Gelidibacter salicanalis TaxID=291193 RepID=A0A934NI47_9FLAO|nr:hypothetical protein [Gelidibacter salicanalis]MBJ7880633.1 hypothetical protein [Gelidibacter salicanalis]